MLKKLGNWLYCYLNGHDPELANCKKIVIESHVETHDEIVIYFNGRTIYYGATKCKRCGKPQLLKI
jgi:hypothetical protein